MNEKKTSKSGSGIGALIVRLVVFGGLGVMLVLAFLDFQQRKYADQTLEKFVDYFEANEFGDYRRTEFDELIVGRPESSTTDSNGQHGSIQIETLTWKGVFRESQVVLFLGLPKDNPSVVAVEKPGDEE